MKLKVISLSVFAMTGCGVPDNHSSNPTANWVQVSAGVFRGARPDQTAMQDFAAQSFKTVLDLEDDDDAIAAETKMANELGLHEVVASMNGMHNPSSASMLTALGTLADTTNYPVFVHCTKGQDRTGVVIALHRIFNQGWSAKDAEKEMLDLGFNTTLVTMKEYFEKKAGLDD